MGLSQSSELKTKSAIFTKSTILTIFLSSIKNNQISEANYNKTLIQSLDCSKNGLSTINLVYSPNILGIGKNITDEAFKTIIYQLIDGLQNNLKSDLNSSEYDIVFSNLPNKDRSQVLLYITNEFNKDANIKFLREKFNTILNDSVFIDNSGSDSEKKILTKLCQSTYLPIQSTAQTINYNIQLLYIANEFSNVIVDIVFNIFSTYQKKIADSVNNISDTRNACIDSSNRLVNLEKQLAEQNNISKSTKNACSTNNDYFKKIIYDQDTRYSALIKLLKYTLITTVVGMIIILLLIIAGFIFKK